jgi:hypothetical protein
MNLSFFQEPELEFGNSGTHVDIPYGMMRHGPLDLGEPTAPTQLRIGIVGTEETISSMRAWFEGCRPGVAAKQSKLGNLFPPFPLRRSFTRLFRAGTYPPLRGTLLKLRETSAILYLRGSVQFFQSYPGTYVPRPLELSVSRAEGTLEQLGKEILSLSKLNWNNTQFDGGEPITVRAARRVGDILKCLPDGAEPQPSFRFYM